jgi:hypothetical protein
MTCTDFNEKWEKYLEPGHYGASIENKEVLEYLDNKFQTLTKNKNFTYSQIKIKYGSARFYCVGIDFDVIQDIEIEINKLLINLISTNNTLL